MVHPIEPPFWLKNHFAKIAQFLAKTTFSAENHPPSWLKPLFGSVGGCTRVMPSTGSVWSTLSLVHYPWLVHHRAANACHDAAPNRRSHGPPPDVPQATIRNCGNGSFLDTVGHKNPVKITISDIISPPTGQVTVKKNDTFSHLLLTLARFLYSCQLMPLRHGFWLP